MKGEERKIFNHFGVPITTLSLYPYTDTESFSEELPGVCVCVLRDLISLWLYPVELFYF